MTREAANRTIADWCGLTLCPEPDSHWHQAGFNQLHDGCTVQCPDFFTSSEACGMVKEKLSEIPNGWKIEQNWKRYFMTTFSGGKELETVASTECISVALMALRIIMGQAVEVEGVE